jgi:hypothetical protein
VNQQQTKYALKRAGEIYNARRNKVRQAHTVNAIELTNEQRLEALRKGAFSVKAEYNGYGRYIENFVKFNDETEASVDLEAIEKEQLILKAEYGKLTDELMLGGQQEALEMLRRFDV